MPISFLDLRRQHDEVGADVRAAVGRVLEGGAYVLGREVEAFEREWARFCGARACAGVANGTDALSLALLASGAVRSHTRPPSPPNARRGVRGRPRAYAL